MSRRRLIQAGVGVGAGLVALRPGVAHAGALQSQIDAAAPGSTLDLTGQSFAEDLVRIRKPLTIIGPDVTFPTTDKWAHSLAIIDTNNVTLQNWVFHGGSICIGVHRSDDVLIKGCSMQGGQVNSAIGIWGTGGDNSGSHRVRVEGCTIVQTATFQTSPLISRGSEDGSVVNTGLEVVDNHIDQGQGDLGWFGVELKYNLDVVITGNTFKGGVVQVSLPETNNTWIENNEFDMRGRPSWGIEVPNADDCTVVGNVCHGDGPTVGGHFVSLNTAPLRVVAEENEVSDVRTFMDTSGDNITVRNNCLTIGSSPGNVLRLFEFEHAPPYANRIVENNGPCDPGGEEQLLSQGKPVTASSSRDTSYEPQFAVDGNRTTRWSSQFSDPQWIRVDLGATRTISRVVLDWEASGNTYQIQTSNNDTDWATIRAVTGGDGGFDDLTVSGTGRYVRMYGTVRNSSFGYSLREFQVYGH